MSGLILLLIDSELVRAIRYTGLVPSLADAILHVTTGTVSWKTLLTLARTYVGEAAFGTAFAAAVGNNKPSSPPPPSSPSSPPQSQRFSTQRSVSFPSHPTTAIVRGDIQLQRATNTTQSHINQRAAHSTVNHRHRSNEATLRLDSDDDNDNDNVEAFDDMDDEEDSHRDDIKPKTTTDWNSKKHVQKQGLTTRYHASYIIIHSLRTQLITHPNTSSHRNTSIHRNNEQSLSPGLTVVWNEKHGILRMTMMMVMKTSTVLLSPIHPAVRSPPKTTIQPQPQPQPQQRPLLIPEERYPPLPTLPLPLPGPVPLGPTR